jgi:hypothetical protein
VEGIRVAFASPLAAGQPAARAIAVGQGFVFLLIGDGTKLLKRSTNATDSQTEFEVSQGWVSWGVVCVWKV